MSGNMINENSLIRFFNESNPKDALYAERAFTDESCELQLKKVLEKQFNEFSDDNDVNKRYLDHIFYKLHYDITSKKAHKSRIFIRWTYRVAAIIIIPLLIFFGIHSYKANSSRDNYWVEIKAPAWTRAQFSLPDGTTGWLNSNSAIRYNGSFTNERTLSLIGEAYFDVAKNPRKPFIVQANEVNVKVLGTRFNIASYKNEKQVEVVLEEGKLVFSNGARDKAYTMKPNDLVVYNKIERDFKVTKVSSWKYTSWRQGKLVFRNDPVDVIARRLERWYNVTVVNNVPASEDLRWRATFVDEDIEKVLDLMKRTLPVDYKIENPNVNNDDTYLKKKIIITLK